MLGVVTEQNTSIVLLGMLSEAWPIFQKSAEYRDGEKDPLDRWSRRILADIAHNTDASDIRFPFGGPPYEPFIRWAFDSGETFPSPVGMLVHHKAGFWISFRGALVFDRPVDALTPHNPCPTCAQPCKSACPVGALAPGQDYDVDACKAHVSSAEGKTCRDHGCLVRRACPVSQSFGRHRDQSAFHMRAFLGA